VRAFSIATEAYVSVFFTISLISILSAANRRAREIRVRAKSRPFPLTTFARVLWDRRWRVFGFDKRRTFHKGF